MKAVVLAAGRGVRLRPLTDSMPKAMLPICNKPLLDHIMDLLRRHGIDEVAVVVGYKEDVVRNHLKGNVTFFRDEKICGTASALYAAKDFIDEDFLLVYGDLFIDASLEGVVETENSMAVYRVKDVSRYGKVIVKNGLLARIMEKSGSGEGLINAGIYHLDPEILDFVEKTQRSERGEYELTDSITMLSEKKGIKIIEIDGYWNDIGYPWDYLDVNEYLLEKHGMIVGEDVEVWCTSVVRKPVALGDGCVLRGCVVEASVIGRGCIIGEFSSVRNSVLMDSTRISPSCTISHSVVSDNCYIGPGSVLKSTPLDGSTVRMRIKGGMVDSKRENMGPLIGSGARIGACTVIMPGAKISSGSTVREASVVSA